jgi:copper(I)-binding protein
VEKVEIPADSTVKLEPGGLHVMLLDLKKDLVVGDTVEVTLTFSAAGEKTLTAEVKEP